jgi:hypothetical protein
MRGFHLLVFVPPLFILYPAFARSPQTRPSAFDWLWLLAAVAPHAWVLWHWMAVADRMEYVDPFTPVMLVLGITAIVTLLEATRRAVEAGLMWMILASLAYMWWGHHLPGLLNARPFTVAEIVESAWLVPTAGGVYGPLTGIVATTIAVFILFGAFMQGSGTGRLFHNLGAALAGRLTGVTALSPVHPVDEARAVGMLDDCLASAGADAMVHCCAEDVPWTVLQRSAATAVSLDCGTLTGALDGLGEFIDSGRTVVLGLLGGDLVTGLLIEKKSTRVDGDVGNNSDPHKLLYRHVGAGHTLSTL